MKNLQAIDETKYLTADNCQRYRRIMRCFFRETEKLHFQLYKEDIFALVTQYSDFETYTMEQLQQDLASLVQWKNLNPIQDPKRVYTIADYKNKQFRYSMSEYAVEVERMTVKLENLFMESGTLAANLSVRLYELLENAENMDKCNLRSINEWWRTLQSDFKRLNQNYQDYLREFYSGRQEKVLKSVEFMIRKDLFITYLQDFVRDLQLNSAKIEVTLQRISANMETTILDLVVKSELEIPRPAIENSEFLEQQIEENIWGQWNVLKSWFISVPDKLSESERILEITNEIIRQIIQNAALIVQLQNWGVSRKEDYRKFIDMFMDCKDIKEAHRLCAHVFGVQNIQHFKVNALRSTDNINESTYNEDSMCFIVRPRTRTYQPRVDKTGFEAKTEDKKAQRILYLQKIEKERQTVLQYIQDGRLDVSKIEDCIPATLRQTLLRWISAANATSTKSGRTEYGQVYTLIKKETRCILHCEDGDLSMPIYIFEFAG
ncbi:TIGR02677 family protein [Propionispira raffinosivorans]|uniref:TIGR02677 family protein n=1 Tax=Propionispira raffinosivorans TaxID=86959 RepID=UPI000373A7A1|nr:TIGR02677 family protein [Propionispira raffinosivorans]